MRKWLQCAIGGSFRENAFDIIGAMNAKTNVTATVIRIQAMRDQVKLAECISTAALTNNALLLDAKQADKLGAVCEHLAEVGSWLQVWQEGLEATLRD
jgi:UDP-N-acetylglucosamine enolpyruvyl transferase